MQKMRIRKARTDEGPILSGIALRSKAYWGYDKNFIEVCREDLTISEQKIEKNHVYVLEDSSGIIGFYCLAAKGKTGSLDFLFIDPGFIGKGYGRLLWESIMQTAREIGLEEFSIDADLLHIEEDLQTLKKREKLITVCGGEYCGELFHHLVSLPASLDDDVDVVKYFEAFWDLFHNEDPERNFKLYQDFYKTAFSGFNIPITADFLGLSVLLQSYSELKPAIIEISRVFADNYLIYEEHV